MDVRYPGLILSAIQPTAITRIALASFVLAAGLVLIRCASTNCLSADVPWLSLDNVNSHNCTYVHRRLRRRLGLRGAAARRSPHRPSPSPRAASHTSPLCAIVQRPNTVQYEVCQLRRRYCWLFISRISTFYIANEWRHWCTVGLCDKRRSE